ncbi:MAG: ribosome silencing factor [Betaproteobacteria bacterium AqS2]|uniref:Ribosomal silencing factor RsfS n=1 Tax=Candidatus Amphirhobacter heronislandensis TaxID=1732024 RepID=A0A930UIC0_9GAMM|nr:ribosome silencing factor [Betaproteobacteria bacterium AqS2]
MTPATTAPTARDDLAELALRALDDAKAVDVTRIDIGRGMRLFDTLLICTATSNRHAAALTEKLRAAVKGSGRKVRGIEGPGELGWTLIDLGDVIVHVFLSDAREHYDLESLWGLAEDA